MSAIRELALAKAIGGGGGGGGTANILYGTEAPDNSIGNDGDVYFLCEMAGFTADPAYVVASTTQCLATQSAAFYKINNKPAIAVHYKNASGNYGPLLVAQNKDAVKYTQNTNEAEILSATIDGVLWYLSGSQYWSASTDSPTIPTLYDLQLGRNATNAPTIIARILSDAHATLGDTEMYILDSFYKKDGKWGKEYPIPHSQ